MPSRLLANQDDLTKKPLTIALNALPVGRGGAWPHVVKILELLPTLSAGSELVVFATEPLASTLREQDPDATVLTLPFTSNALLRLPITQLLLPLMLRRYQADVLHTLESMDVFLSPCPVAMEISNMQPFDDDLLSRTKALRSRLRIVALRYGAKLSSYTVDRIITESRTAAENLTQTQGYPADKIRYRFLSAEADELRGGVDVFRERGLDEPYLLTVAHITRYKNLVELAEGYKIALEQMPELPRLFVLGRVLDADYNEEFQRALGALNLTNRILPLGEVDRNSLCSLYRGASLFVFSSTLETCPVTLIEAFKCGAAVASSDSSVMPEICQDAAEFFDAYDPESIARALLRVLRDDHRQSELRRLAAHRAKAFSWHTTVNTSVSYLQEMAADPRSNHRRAAARLALALLGRFL